jgi:hypothetical protein
LRSGRLFPILLVISAGLGVLDVLLAKNMPTQTKPIDIGGRRELFVDPYLIDQLKQVELRLQTPQPQPMAKQPLCGGYLTVIKDDSLYRAYYRGSRPDYKGPRYSGSPEDVTCYAESNDGHEWTFPDLKIYDIKGPDGNNVILADTPSAHNFAPFIDTKPGVAREERFKALGGLHKNVPNRNWKEGDPDGLYAFFSGDGIHWKQEGTEPVFKMRPFGFDSQNVAFWSEEEQCYVCFIRTWTNPPDPGRNKGGGGYRSISRISSPDFRRWTGPEPLAPNLPNEHLYTSQTHPYFRAPHIYIALPTRFIAGRKEITDIMFMSLRAGAKSYNRLFKEAFIRPGLDPKCWGNRSNYVACNVVPTGPDEMSIYHQSGRRYVLRTDGFCSARAGAQTGELLTKPLIFAGNELNVNYSTSASGSLRIEIQNPQGEPIPGFRRQDCVELFGDSIDQPVKWGKAGNLAVLAGKPVRLCFVMNDCDLYAFQFILNGK